MRQAKEVNSVPTLFFFKTKKKKKMHEVEQDGKILPILIYIYIFDNFLIRKERI